MHKDHSDVKVGSKKPDLPSWLETGEELAARNKAVDEWQKKRKAENAAWEKEQRQAQRRNKSATLVSRIQSVFSRKK